MYDLLIQVHHIDKEVAEDKTLNKLSTFTNSETAYYSFSDPDYHTTLISLCIYTYVYCLLLGYFQNKRQHFGFPFSLFVIKFEN